MPVELVIFVGLQGAGKSTYYRAHHAATHDLVSKDLWPNLRRPERRQRRLIAEALAAGRSVVVDNTNPTAAERAPLLALGRAAGAVRVGFYFDDSLDACLARNRQRTGRACVPDVALLATMKKLEVPSLEEGFDELFAVRLAGEAAQGFVLRPLVPATLLR